MTDASSPSAPALARVDSRSWMEFNVRPWLAVTALMAVLTVALGAYTYREASRERWLIERGAPVKATVVDMGADTRQKPRDDEVRVKLRYADPKTGRQVESERLLHRVPGGMVALNDVLDVKVDPDNPPVWTERKIAPPLLQGMTVPAAMVPVVLLSLFMTWLQRRRVTRAFSRGTPTTAEVTSVRQPALAPMSKQIGLALVGPDRTVRQAYWPARNGPVAKGDFIPVIADGSLVIPTKSYT
jgi:hypothetical protein